MSWVDSHCHLDFEDFDADRADVIARAHAAGVGTLLAINTRLAHFPRVRAVAETPNIFCTVGVHPHNVDEEPECVTADTLLRLADDPKVVGFGETGLDYYYDHSDRTRQQQSFRAHIAAAREAQLPIIVHSRDAEDDTIQILTEEYTRGPFPGVIHCFTAGSALRDAAVSIGFAISLSGILTFKSASALRETVASVPLDNLLVETDSPYLAPMPHRGQRCEPAFVVKTGECLAALKGVSIETLRDATTANFHRLFRKVPS